MFAATVVSIHAPARGATSRPPANNARRPCFNSRARKGRDFSPYAPSVLLEFQFTRPQGARPATGRRCGTRRGFNSRARKGRDNWHYKVRVLRIRFNSRARKGRDIRAVLAGALLRVSIHAPVRGATDGRADGRRPGGVSIHAPARGATFDQYGWRRNPEVSIHAPARGATNHDWHP